jgi:hypothetical protein
MKKTTQADLAPVFDIDLVCWLQYSGMSIAKVADEGGRIAFYFPAAKVAEKQTELTNGTCMAEVNKWSALVRRIHSEFLSPSAKASIRARSARRHSDE